MNNNITLDFSAIITESKKDFTRYRSSKIKNYLMAHPNAIITSEVEKKNRAKTIRFYYLKNNQVKKSDYVKNNANIILDAWKEKGGEVIDTSEL